MRPARRPLTGWGIDQFKISGPLITLGLKQPHNIFLQILFSVGLIGTILALIAGLPLFRKLRGETMMRQQ
jgi:O-antigen ligase